MMTSLGSALIMTMKMLLLTLTYAGVTFMLWKVLRGRDLTFDEKLALGGLYGILSIMSTHFGVDYGNMIVNVRDLGPMCAGIIFDPFSGIFAGVIGGAERYMAGTLWGVGEYTTVACSISTCLAGFLAAFLNRFIFRGGKPSVPYAFFMGAAIEVFHMYAILVTHRNDIGNAFTVVKIISVPMILFSGLGLAMTVAAIQMYSGEWRNPFRVRAERDVPLSDKFQVWLFVVTAIVLVGNFSFAAGIQTEAAIQEARNDLEEAVLDIEDTYNMVGDDPQTLKRLVPHVGHNGLYFIFDGSGSCLAGSTDNPPKGLPELAEGRNYGELFRGQYNGRNCLMRKDRLQDGAILITMIWEGEIYTPRDIQSYATFLADVLLFTILFVLISMLVQNIVVNNLRLVNDSLNKITEGNLDETVDVYSAKEFAMLSDDINETVDVLEGYIIAAEKRIEQELMLARTIQDSALPKNFDLNHREFEIFATMDPAREVGGDFYDFFLVGSDKLALVIADVSGKGIPAALFMMRSKSAIRGMMETGTDPAGILERVNTELCKNNEAAMFVTVWIGIADLRTGKVICVNAGHEYPAVRRAGGTFELFKDKHCPPLGVMEEMSFTAYEMQLEPGDRLFVYTDGVPEAINTAEEQYGTERMLDVLNRYSHYDMKRVLPAVKRDVDKFVGEADQFDDITMMGFRFIGMEDKD